MTNKWRKNVLQEQKNVKSKKIPFFQEKIKNDGLNKFLGHVSPFLMPIILLGIETFGPAKYALVSFWQPRQPLALVAQAVGHVSC